MTFMPVFIEKSDGIVANEVLFKITPLTVQEAEARNIINFTRPDTHTFSPSIAGIGHIVMQILGLLLKQGLDCMDTSHF
jgi:hypothetical protein